MMRDFAVFSGIDSSKRIDSATIKQHLDRVRVLHYAQDGYYPLAGKSIGEVRKGLRASFNLPSDETAWLNGIARDDATILRNGDDLEFGKSLGTKGGFPDFVSESEIRHLYGDDGYQRMLEAGLTPVAHPVFCGHDVAAFGRSLTKTSATLVKPVPVTVDIDGETLTYKDCKHDCERTLALVLQCLIDAHGEIRSTTDIKKTFPDEPWEERLDTTINRKLKKHKSGVGEMIEPVEKRGYRLRIEAFK